tara:strand:+ start:1288 stop:1461 length:174 start_codon:yes stop_codon:yes gene_type:complete
MAALQAAKTQPKENFGQKVQKIGAVIGTIKGIYDTGRTIYSVAQAAAPYMATAAAFL